jgi:hypothetical protein
MRTLPVVLAIVACSCGGAAPSEKPVMSVTRTLGSWHGRGNQTIGIVSESGRLRVRWETKNESSPGGGTFRLALHSGVSGRPIQLLADSHGESQGTADVVEDPRPYNFMVESTNLDWSFSVDEIVAGSTKP